MPTLTAHMPDTCGITDVRSEDMTCSVVLIAYHGDRWLPACLQSLAQASAQPPHLVLVDNDGNSTISELDLSPFDIEVLCTPRPMGFAEANNFALTNASHLEETVLFLNQDTISPAGWIDICSERAEGNVCTRRRVAAHSHV